MKLPTIWTDEKHSQEEAEPGRNSDVEKVRREKIRDGESQKREDAGVFPMFCGSGGSKSRLPKAADAEPAGQMKDESLHAVVAESTLASQTAQSTSGPESGALLEVEMLKKRAPFWREARLEMKMYKARRSRSTFGS